MHALNFLCPYLYLAYYIVLFIVQKVEKHLFIFYPIPVNKMIQQKMKELDRTLVGI